MVWKAVIRMGVETDERQLILTLIAPDGVQGPKIILGFVDDLQKMEFELAITASGKGFDMKNIIQIAQEKHIPRVDH